MNYSSLVIFLVYVAVSQGRNLEKQNSDSQNQLERRDYEHLSESVEYDREESKEVDGDREESKEVDDYREDSKEVDGDREEKSLDDDGVEEGFQESLMNIILRMVSKNVVGPDEVDKMGVTYVNKTKEYNAKIADFSGTRNNSLNNGSKFTDDNIPALRHAYNSLDSALKVEPSQILGALNGRLDSAALEDNITGEKATTEPNYTTAEVSGTINSTLMVEKPQARFGCLVSSLCTICQQYAILPDNTHVCCLFCSIHPTLVPNNNGGFICSCDYFGP